MILAGGMTAGDQIKPEVPDKPDNRSLTERGKKDPKTGEIEIKDIPYMDILVIKPESVVIEYYRGNLVLPGKENFKLAKEVKITVDGKAATIKDVMMMRAETRRIMPSRLKLSKDKAIIAIDAKEFRLPDQ